MLDSRVMAERNFELNVLLADYQTGLREVYQGKVNLLPNDESLFIPPSMHVINQSSLVIALMEQPFMQMVKQCDVLTNQVETRLFLVDEHPRIPGTWCSTETWSYHVGSNHRSGFISMPRLWKSVKSKIRPGYILNNLFEAAYTLEAAVTAGEMLFYIGHDTSHLRGPGKESMRRRFVMANTYSQVLKLNILKGIQEPAIVPMLTLTPLLLSEGPARAN